MCRSNKTARTNTAPTAGAEGEDSFKFRVTDPVTGIASVATVSAYVGVDGPEISEETVVSYDFLGGGDDADTIIRWARPRHPHGGWR